MRKLIASEFVSLDGIMENPSWTFKFPSKEQEDFKFAELSAAGALLLGRVTYEGFAAAWPNMSEQAGEYADMMNGYPKYVVSKTLEAPLEWSNSTLLRGDVAEEVSALKEQPGRDVLIFGSGELVNALMEHDLIDEYRLMVFPIVAGGGKRLFGDRVEAKVMEHVGTETFGSGVIVLTYRPASE
ncbi:dihydrofolate reductase family protein [Rubrobacter calidifluminis]|uniref:dihydrofolate reductase family protein n=1 Tax=Rubrobacter calidifluminis TaxID=1392640 RepID=UPI00235F623F|nr:dihydrofolate reductase family protein [Rubrobacter calidifluminis]